MPRGISHRRVVLLLAFCALALAPAQSTDELDAFIRAEMSQRQINANDNSGALARIVDAVARFKKWPPRTAA